MRRLAALTFFILFQGCAGPTSRTPATRSTLSDQKDAPPASTPSKPAHPPTATVFWGPPEVIGARCQGEVARLKELVLKTRALAGAPSALEAMNQLLLGTNNLAGQMELVASVHPSEVTRGAAERCEQEVKKMHARIRLDPSLYAVLEQAETSSQAPGASRFVSKLKLEMELAGVHQPEAVRTELRKLHDRLVEVGQSFGRNIRNDTRSLRVRPEDLRGLPEDFIENHPPEEDGKVTLTTAYPDYFPVQTYAQSRRLRKRLAKAFLTRAHPVNQAVLREMIDLRHEYAQKLGFSSWADYHARDKMAGSAEAIRDFTKQVVDLVRPRLKKDLKVLLREKRKDEPKATRIEVWDRFYYVDKVRKTRFAVDAAEARAFFPYSQVLNGVLELYGDLFSLDLVHEKNAPVWHEDVLRFRAEASGRVVGYFYLDMHPREGKFPHAAVFPLVTGTLDGQLPEAALVCNFPSPQNGAALMEHQQVVTFFHELGHLIHHLLATRSRWANQAGITVEWDFVETPSQLLEEWAWSPEVLQRFARHHETGLPISTELVERMRAANEFGKGVHIMRQLFYQSISLQVHDRSPEAVDFLSITKRIHREVGPFPYVQGTHVYASFGHLGGYSSAYYTYQWSLARAKDALTRFQSAGLFDRTVMKEYRDTILAQGGSRPARELLEDFLGRPFSLDAYRNWLEN